MDASVKGKANGKGMDWDIFRSVVLHNLEDKSDEKESHEEFNDENLHHQVAFVVAAVGGAKLR